MDTEEVIKKQRHNLEELNELTPGLGDTIEKKLAGHKYWWEFRDVERYILMQLEKLNLTPSDIFINGNRNLEEIFVDESEKYQRISIANFVI
ncbi:MAG: hypothetical protein WCJ25_00255 [Candidatus Moraniibacteriota bacterium]